jgi:hypothetical protein
MRAAYPHFPQIPRGFLWISRVDARGFRLAVESRRMRVVDNSLNPDPDMDMSPPFHRGRQWIWTNASGDLAIAYFAF